MKLKIRVLRQLIRESVKRSTEEEANVPYRAGNEESLMLDQPGMEKKYRNKIRDYLRSLGMIK